MNRASHPETSKHERATALRGTLKRLTERTVCHEAVAGYRWIVSLRLEVHASYSPLYTLPNWFCRDARVAAVGLNHSLLSNPKIPRKSITMLLDFRRTSQSITPPFFG